MSTANEALYFPGQVTVNNLTETLQNAVSVEVEAVRRR